MIENIKKDLAHLIAESEKKDLSQPDQFHFLKKRINKIDARLHFISEQLRILLSTLHQNSSSSYIESPTTAFFKTAAKKKLMDTNDFLGYKSKKEMSRVYLRLGELLYQKNRIDEALDVWEAVLRTDPCHEHIHSRMNSILNKMETGDSK